MFKKLYFIIVFMFFIMLPNNAIASPISSTINTNPTISNIYTEGIYKFDNTTDVDMIVMLNNDLPTKLIIFDNEMNVEFLSTLPYNNKFYIRNFKAKQIVGVIGEGEVAISFEPIKK